MSVSSILVQDSTNSNFGKISPAYIPTSSPPTPSPPFSTTSYKSTAFAANQETNYFTPTDTSTANICVAPNTAMTFTSSTGVVKLDVTLQLTNVQFSVQYQQFPFSYYSPYLTIIPLEIYLTATDASFQIYNLSNPYIVYINLGLKNSPTVNNTNKTVTYTVNQSICLTDYFNVVPSVGNVTVNMNVNPSYGINGQGPAAPTTYLENTQQVGSVNMSTGTPLQLFTTASLSVNN